jgi:hypothetical protein
MTPRGLFEVAVRTLGAAVLVWGLWDLTNAALFYNDYFRNPDMSVRYYLIFGWVSIFLGLILMRFSRIVGTFAYENEATESKLRAVSNDVGKRESE